MRAWRAGPCVDIASMNFFILGPERGLENLSICCCGVGDEVVGVAAKSSCVCCSVAACDAVSDVAEVDGSEVVGVAEDGGVRVSVG